MERKAPAYRHSHSHLWLVGLFGLTAGLVLLVYVPKLRAVSSIPILFAGFRLVGVTTLLTSLYLMAGKRLTRRWAHHHRGGLEVAAGTYDFGWSPEWTIGPALASLVAIAAAVALQVAAPAWWPISFLLVLLAASFFAGHLITRASGQADDAVFPMVDLLTGDSGLVLDGGCGAGRTTIAVARAFKKGRIIALDRFDADYIDGGGRALLEHNLRLAGLEDRVSIVEGDLTQLPFPDGTFDSAVSAHALDHLGRQKEQGLREMKRVLKPGGRFLLVVWVPGWTMFAVANILSFSLTAKAVWRRMAGNVGLETLDEGSFNGVWYLLLGKPAIEAL